MDEGEADLESKRQELTTRRALQRDVLLATARGFADLLAGDAAATLIDLKDVQAKGEEGWSTEELQAHAVETWRDLTLARAQGVLRRYHVVVAPIVDDVKVRVAHVGCRRVGRRCDSILSQEVFAGCDDQQVQEAIGAMLVI